mmetsp:Transcript_19471/g.36362  ORF Transcript_19471/g.36362 Transcript_19471/m.36362 type:complete len:114 (-) Transcript_19471:281-622(-)
MREISDILISSSITFVGQAHSLNRMYRFATPTHPLFCVHVIRDQWCYSSNITLPNTAGSNDGILAHCLHLFLSSYLMSVLLIGQVWTNNVNDPNHKKFKTRKCKQSSCGYGGS